MSTPRILAIPSPFAFVNPTWDVLLSVLVRDHGCFVVGPKTRIPCNSIAYLVNEYGQFDCILCDPWFFFQGSNLPVQYRPNDLFGCGLPVVLSLMQYDLHSLSKQFMSRARNKSSIVISAATSPQFWKPMDRAFAREAWLDPAGYSNTQTDVIDDHFALVPHCLAPNEFATGDTVRRFDVSVLGARYHFRRLAVEFLKDKGIRVCQGDRLQKILGELATRFPFGARISKLNRPPGLELYRWRYRQFILRSNISVTCDGSIGYPVRKFFEIPALGAALVAKFFPSPDALGFRDGETAFVVDEEHLDRLLDIVDAARRRAPEIERVRRQGTEMVRELHTAEVRAAQLVALMAEVAGQRPVTTRWVDGRQEIVPRASRPPSVDNVEAATR